MRNFILVLSAFLMVLLARAQSADAAESAWQTAGPLQSRMVTASNTATALNGVLQLQIAPGWHMYWRTPGETGKAPSFDWGSSANVGAVTLEWPAPQRFIAGGLQSFGYTGLVSFPVAAKITAPDQPTVLQVKMTITACAAISNSCISQTLTVALPVSAGAAPPADQALVTQARAALPAKNEQPALKITGFVVGPDALVATVYAAHGLKGVDLFVEPAGLHLTQPPQITPDPADPRSGQLRIAKTMADQNPAKDASGQTLILTLTGPDGAVEKTVPF